MDLYSRPKRGSTSSNAPFYSSPSLGVNMSTFPNTRQSRTPYSGSYHPLLPPSSAMLSGMQVQNSTPVQPLERSSYYFSPLPLYCSDWVHLSGLDVECIALSSYKEGFINKLQVVHGIAYDSMSTRSDLDEMGPELMNPGENVIEGFDMHKVADTSVDYPITKLQWDPSLSGMNNGSNERIAASSEILRLYKVDHDSIDQNNDYLLTQTHSLANTSTANSSTSSSGGSSNIYKEELNTLPPVTSFDWNKTDPSLIITSSIDTTCTVWDLHRSHPIQDKTLGLPTDTATIKTQLIAHDSEVFDVKFVHNSTNIFASVGNDGSMRVFDLRSLEHSTIIYEPITTPSASYKSSTASKALLKLSTSNIDQFYMATVGVNSNQVIIIDMRMPGLPVSTLDGSLGGVNTTAINSVSWHPTSNHLLTGGDDCHALVWDCNNLNLSKATSSELGVVIDSPVMAYQEDLEVNNACWRQNDGDWMGVVSGKGFQAVKL